MNAHTMTTTPMDDPEVARQARIKANKRRESFMKIRDVRAVGLRGATPAGGWSDELKREDSVHTLVAVHTDDGLVGIGSVFTSEALVRAALEVLRPLFEGENALEPERVSEKLHRATFWLGRGGTVTHSIGGIDMALWDILGQATGQPVGRLLGGMWRDRVKPYASLLMDEPEPLSDKLQIVAEQGFRAFKIGWGPFGRHNSRKDEEIVKAARAAIGPDAMLMVDAGGSDGRWANGYKWARNTAHMLADYDVSWFEEPLKPDALEDFVSLRAASPVPISGGEVFTRRQAFIPWIEARAFDIVQPDVTKVGGLSEQRRIGWCAHDHGVRVIPHGWNTAIGLAADLQFAAAMPDTDLVEYIAGSAYVDDVVQTAWKLDEDGMLAIPSEPGMGIQLDPDALSKYADSDFLLKL